jgi:translation initiation factor IF-2
MTETKETSESSEKKKLGLSRPGRLELKKTVEAGQVRQSFSHGRTKTVTVEVRRKRTFAQAADGAMQEVREPPEGEAAAQPTDTGAVDEALAALEPAGESRKTAVPRTLTEEEKAARARALKGARRAETDAQVVADESARLAELRAEEEAEERRQREAEEEARRVAAEEAARAAASAEVAAPAPAPRPAAAAVKKPAEADEDATKARRPGRPDARRQPAKRLEPRRRGGRLTIAQALEDEERMRSLASVRRARERERRAQQRPMETVKVVRDVTLPETITVQELANRMAERSSDVIKALMRMGVMATINQTIDADTAELLVAEFGHRSKRVSEADVEIGLKGEADLEENLSSRPPVVTVMGHVDHGKTSLLDALREANVVAGEAGGITQHIGAYQVVVAPDKRITFIDTPGHEAFSAMRARGATVTDIVVLVVAADDGIMPQTVEAINHAKAAQVPLIVAINKIDRPNADPARVRNELLHHDLVVEDLGGDVLSVEVSATQRTNLDKLIDAILLQAEILELKANPERSAEGVVIEARLERGRGAVTTVLVQRGTLKIGDIVVAGGEWGRVRAMVSDTGERVEAAGPSTPVEVLGLNAAPAAGDELAVVENEARAREITEFRQRRARDNKAATVGRGTLEQMFSEIESGRSSELPLVVKADVQGSIEAIVASAEKISTDEVSVRVLHTGVGAINESDITLAKASEALVVGFNVRANPQARELAEREHVDVRYYAIIYNLIDDLKQMLSGLLAPTLRETLLGNATILEVFNVSKVGKVAGCRITDGVVKRGARVRLLRDGVVIHEGRLGTLKRFKDEVREVREGFECGMGFENYQDLKADDVIECFEVEEIARTL